MCNILRTFTIQLLQNTIIDTHVETNIDTYIYAQSGLTMKKLLLHTLAYLLGCIIASQSCFAETYARSIPITCSQNASASAAFNQRFMDFLEHWQIPGASIAVMHNGKMLVSCGFGWADVDAHEVVQPYSLFRLGSVSKTLTAISILQLIQENKLRFEDKVFDILNDLQPLHSDSLSTNSSSTNSLSTNNLNTNPSSTNSSSTNSSNTNPSSTNTPNLSTDSTTAVSTSNSTFTTAHSTGKPTVLNPDLYKMTVRNLLQMSSGWYVDRPQDFDPLMGPWSSEMFSTLKNNIPPDCKTATQIMMNVPLQFTPGTQFSYSNINYCLLGLIINKKSGQPGYAGYESYIRKRLLAPYGITQMQLGRSELKNKAPNEVKYYYNKDPNLFVDIDRIIDGLPYGDTDMLRKNYSDGGWIASTPDLVKLLQAFGNHKILNPDMIKQMTAKPAFAKTDSGYSAMGWDKVNYWNGQRYLVKTGSFTGTQALIMQSDNGISYAVLFNAKPSNHKQFIKELEALLLQSRFSG